MRSIFAKIDRWIWKWVVRIPTKICISRYYSESVRINGREAKLSPEAKKHFDTSFEKMDRAFDKMNEAFDEMNKRFGKIK